jgi:hypothetical protein
MKAGVYPTSESRGGLIASGSGSSSTAGSPTAASVFKRGELLVRQVRQRHRAAELAAWPPPTMILWDGRLPFPGDDTLANQGGKLSGR